MNIRFQPEKRDVISAIRTHGAGLRRLIWLPLMMSFLATALLLTAFVTKRGDPRATWMQVYPVFIIAAVFVALWQWSEYAAWKNVRVAFMSWHFGEEEVTFETDRAAAQMKWPAFLYYKEGETVFLLYPQKNIFHFFPKRILSDAEIEAFRKLLASHISKK